MALIFNNTTIKGVNFNGTTVKKVIYNGEVVFTADNEIYKDGVLADGVTLSNFTNQSNELYSSNEASPKTWEGADPTETRKTCTITFDMTNYSSITVKFHSGMWGYDQNTFTRQIGIDTASETLSGGYHGGWETDGQDANFERTFDVSGLTGEHSIVVSYYNKNLSDYYLCISQLAFTEIMAYS